MLFRQQSPDLVAHVLSGRLAESSRQPHNPDLVEFKSLNV
jgi:hypothetical protein